jgi:hypothetical protein
MQTSVCSNGESATLTNKDPGKQHWCKHHPCHVSHLACCPCGIIIIIITRKDDVRDGKEPGTLQEGMPSRRQLQLRRWVQLLLL